ncbi:MAG TPA: efflux RND transporter permease subunit, partial [Sumerlaeia bacterium]|nr:efflux RND transporter permease subunit [Sumerlaeia bacterium]
IRMAKLVRERIGEIRNELAPGFDLAVVWDEAESLEKLIRNLAKLAVLGAVLAVAVLVVFLRSVRVAAVVAVAIPASVLITFNAMYAAGVTINMVSLLGLVAGVGMLVDNSIVVVENIFRHSRRRVSPREAAWFGTREVAYAIFISTATNLVVFLPIFYIDAQMAAIAKDMALTLVFSMSISLVIAVTLVPMLASKMIALARRAESSPDRNSRSASRPRGIGRLLSRAAPFIPRNPWRKPGRPPRNLLKELIFFCAGGSLRHPLRLFFSILALLLATLIVYSLKVAIQRFDPNRRVERITLYGKPPLGSTLEEADAFFLAQERRIGEEIAKSDVFESFSSRFSKTGGEIALNVSEKYRRLEEREFRDAYKRLGSGDQNSGFRFHPFPEAAQQIEVAGMRGRPNLPEAVLVTGENMDAMRRAAEKIEELLREEENIGEIQIEDPTGNPEVHFHPDLELFQVMKADPSGLQTFFRARDDRGIRTSLVLREGDVERRVTVRARSEEEEEEKKVKQTLSELKRTLIPLQGGGMVPLDRLGSFSVSHGAPYISKKNRQRHVRVEFGYKEVYRKSTSAKEQQDYLKTIQERLNAARLPTGVSAALSGTLEEAGTATIAWRKTLALAILSVYLVMAFFSGSLISPVAVLVTLPLACIGGVWGVILFNAAFDEIARVASLLLIGLAVNNGILLIDYAQRMERHHGFSRSRALMTAVAYRFRPILMTSLTTILGLLPILLSEEAADEARSLVSVLVGGIVVSALLSLVVVPPLYNTFSLGHERLRLFLKRRPRLLRRIRSVAPDLAPAPACATVAATQIVDRSERTEPFPMARSAVSAIPARARPISPSAFDRSFRISIQNVSKIYPAFRARKLLNVVPSRTWPYGHRPPTGTAALRRVSLEIDGGMFGLLGPNGAGKTTLMKILTGIVEPTYGVVQIAGCDMRFHRHEIRRFISYLPQNFGVYEALDLDQYLNFFARYYGLDDKIQRRRKIDEVVALVGLEDARGKPMKRFSGGMRQRAGIAQMLLNPLPIIIIDEPTAGLDPVERVRFRLLLSELARTRVVILSTHIVDDITSSCKRVAVLNKGELIYEGAVEGVRDAGQGLIWDIERPADEEALPVARRQVLYRKHLGD